MKPLAVILSILFGLGITQNICAEDLPPLPDAALEIVATLEKGPGNIAVTPEGRIIISLHQFYEPEYRVMELLQDGRLVPFPNEDWSRPPAADGVGLNAVLGLRADRRGVVWMLDNGGKVPKVVAWDTQFNRLHRIIHIPEPVTRPGSLHNDLAVDRVNEALYIADIGGDKGPAVVVVDLKTGQSRRLLEGHPSVLAEDLSMVIEGREVTLGAGPEKKPARVGINPITIDPTNTWVYYGAMHGDDIWRIRTRDLLDTSLSPEDLGKRVERFGQKPVSDGISIDGGGYLYITDVVQNAIGVTGPRGHYRVYVRDKDVLVWPDGISAGPDGWMYATVNKLHRSAFLAGGENRSAPPFYIVRFRSIFEAIPGR